MASIEKEEEVLPSAWGIEAIITRLYDFVDSMDSKKQLTYGGLWFGLAVVLITVSSLNFGDAFRWISPLVGWPAGVILFAIVLSVIHATNLKNLTVFEFKDRVPPRRRVTPTLVGLAIVAGLLISSSSWMPTGLGGSIMIVAVLSVYNIIRRTPVEIELAARGLPDPREIEVEEDDFEEYSEEEKR